MKLIKVLTTIYVAIKMLTGTEGVWAEQLTSMYSVDFGFEATDNERLSSTNEKSLLGYYISPDLEVSLKRETLQVNSLVAADFSRFNRNRSNADEVAFNIAGDYSPVETQTLNAWAGYEVISIRTSELLDTGRIEESGTDKEDQVFGLGYTFWWNETNRFQLTVDRSEVGYESERYQNYNFDSQSVAWVRSLSDKLELQIIVYQSQYYTQASIATEYDSQGLTMATDWQLTEQWSLALSGGSNQVETNLNSIDSEKFLLETTLKRHGLRNKFSVLLAKTVDPSGDGVLKATEKIVLENRHVINDRFNQFVNLSVLRSESVGEGFDDARNYAALKFGFHQRVNKSMALSAEYRYKYQDFETDHSDAHGVFFRLHYKSQRKFW